MTLKMLRDELNKIANTKGHAGKTEIAFKSGVSVPTIEKARKPDSSPRPETAYKLALAAGFDESAAQKIANECTKAKAG